jgi:uncharacterized protein involved in outer membrane biogenesis
MTRGPKTTLLIVGTLAGAVALAFALVGSNALKGAIEWGVSARTGHQLTIAGDLRVELGRRTRVTAHEVRLANAPGARVPDLFTARRVTAVLSLPALLAGKLDLHELELLAPRLAVEHRADAAPFASGVGGRRIRIRSLRVDEGTATFIDAGTETDLVLRVAAAGTDAEDDLKVSAQGIFRGVPLKASARGPTVLTLQGPGKPYPFVAEVRAGATTVQLRGTAGGLGALDFEFALRGDDLAHLGRLTGLPVPSTPPYQLRGQLRRTAPNWRLEGLSGRIGESDVSGTLAFAERPRRRLEIRVASDRLDFDDLGPLIGAPPRTVGERASPEQRRQAQRMQDTGRALPDKPLATDRWRQVDVELTLTSKRVLHPPALPIEALDAHVRIADGVLRLDPLRMRLAGGTAIAQVRLDGRAAPLRGTAEVEFHGLELRKLFPTIEAMRKAQGLAHGRARLAGTGDSVRALLGSADGRISLAVDRGRISNLLLELLGLDAAESLLIFTTGDRDIPLRCAIADLDLANGIATTNVLVLDTPDTVVVGSGIVDLRREAIDLTLHPRPKDASLLAARSPLHLGGSLRNPRVRPDASALAARGIGAAVLALVNPLLALAPFIEVGPGRDSDCAGLLEAANDWSPPNDSRAPRPGAAPR